MMDFYFGARYYDPTIGRFITRDPVKGNHMNPQTSNPYVYCLNNPLKYIDPNGQRPLDWEEEDWWGKGKTEEEILKSMSIGNKGMSGRKRRGSKFRMRYGEYDPSTYKEFSEIWGDFKEWLEKIESLGIEISLNYVIGIGIGYGVGFVYDKETGWEMYWIFQQGYGVSVGGDTTFFVSTESAENVANSSEGTGIEVDLGWSVQIYGKKEYAGHNKYHLGGGGIGIVYWADVTTDEDLFW